MNPNVLPTDLDLKVDQELFWFTYWFSCLIEGCTYSYLFERVV